MLQFKYIDGLRGLAILGVIIVHTSQYGTSIYTDGISLYPGFINRIFEQGARGVQLFYVVSAFTLFLSFYNRSNSQSKFSNKNFFIRRIFRVAPLYWVAILYFGFIAPHLIFHSTKELSEFTVLANLTLLNSLYPGRVIVPGGWTISVEMLFYCMLPFLFRYITTLKRATIFTLISIVFSIIYGFLFFKLFQRTETMEYFYFASIPNQLPLFGFGIIAYFLKFKDDNKLPPSLLFIIGVLIIFQLTLVRFIPNHILFGVSFMILVIIGDKICILKNRFLAYLGKISYSAYFVHFAVLALLEKLKILDFTSTTTHPLALLNFLLRLGLVLSIVILISTFTYYIIETPTQNLGKKIIHARKKHLQIV